MRNSVLIDDQDHCIICGSDMINRHHVFHGTANRKLAETNQLAKMLIPRK